MDNKIVNESNLNGIHIWLDGSIHLDIKKWDIEQGKRIIHIYRK